MRLLITGGAGCLGSNLVEKFYPLGHEICVIDNFATGKREVVPDRKGLQVVEGSIADHALVNSTFESFKPTHVINSAAAYKDPLDWAEDINTNVLGSVLIGRASMEHGVARLINLQTALCYGRPSMLPIDVSAPTLPFTSYGISKTAGEAYLMQTELEVVSLRLANICGPRLAIGPIPTFFSRLKSGKDCFCSDTTRDFLDISDFFTLIDKVLVVGAPTGLFNVSTGQGHSILTLYKTVCEYLKIDAVDVPIIPVGQDDVKDVVLDPIKTTDAFEWKAAVSFKETIFNQLTWYEKYGVNEIFSHLAPPGEIK